MITPGYEYAPVTPMSIYDDRMMLATVAAAKDMYDKAEKKLDDFYEKYGDFYSPIANDMQTYHDMTVGKIQNVINDMYKNGIDPLRSAEGRQILNKAIRSIDTNTLGAIKENAKLKEKYIDTYRTLQAQGLVNEDYEDWIMGTRGYNDFQTVGDDGKIRMWDRPSPSQYKDVAALSNHYVKNLKPVTLSTDPHTYTKVMGYEKSITDQAADAYIQQIESSESGKYQKALAEQRAAKNKTTVDDELRNMFYEANPHLLQQETITDDRAIKIAESQAKQAKDRAYAKYYNDKANGNNGGQIKTFTENLRERTSLRDNTPKFEDQLQSLKNVVSALNKAGRPGLVRNGKTWMESNKVQKLINDVTAAGNNKQKQQQALIDNGIYDKDGKQTKYGESLFKLANKYYGKRIEFKDGTIKGYDDRSDSQVLEDYYKTQVPKDEVQSDMLLTLFTGSDKNDKSTFGFSDETRTFNTANAGWDFSINRALSLSGRKNTRARELKKWIRDNAIHAEVRSASDVTHNSIRNNGGQNNDLDVSGTILIRVKDLDKYFKSHNVIGNEAKGKYLNDLGFSTVELPITKHIILPKYNNAADDPHVGDQGVASKENETFVRIPVTKTTELDKGATNELDIFDLKNKYGANNAYKEGINPLVQAYLNSGQYDNPEFLELAGILPPSE